MKNGTMKNSKVGATPNRGSNGKNACFAFECANAKAVCLAGTFNDWDGSAMPLHAQANGSWAVALTLPPGTYEYQFVVDGCWMPDPKARESVPNPYGGVNSILRVPAEA